jgi:RIO kinase 2
MECNKEGHLEPEDESEEDEETVEVEGSEAGEEEEEDAGSSREDREHEDEERNSSVDLRWAQAQGDAQKTSGSRSQEPPRSASTSPASQLASNIENSHSVNASERKDIRDKAAIDAYKERARQKQKYHSRRGAERIGRAKGSKGKLDNRVKVDKSGLWD